MPARRRGFFQISVKNVGELMSLHSFRPEERDALCCLSSSGSLGRHFPAFKVICKTTTAGSPLQVARFLHLLPDIDAADPVFVFPCGLATKAGLLPAGCAGTFLVFPGWCPETANTNSARRQPALPSSRVTPSNACPTHRTTVVSSRPACAAMRHTSYSQR